MNCTTRNGIREDAHTNRWPLSLVIERGALVSGSLIPASVPAMPGDRDAVLAAVGRVAGRGGAGGPGAGTGAGAGRPGRAAQAADQVGPGDRAERPWMRPQRERAMRMEPTRWLAVAARAPSIRSPAPGEIVSNSCPYLRPVRPKWPVCNDGVLE